jgi:nitroreductase
MNAPASQKLKELLDARYGNAPKTLDVMNETIDTLLQHRSVRAYTDQPLAPNTLELLIAAAQSASTSSNLQTWSVVAVEDPARKQRLSELAGKQAFINSAPLFLVWIADLARMQTLGDKHEKPYGSLNYFEMMLVATIDSTLAAQNAAIAAESLGLGTVYIGAIRNNPEGVAQELGLPPRAFATFGMCVGHADLAQLSAIKPRLPQASVLHKEQYNLSVHEQVVPGYNETMDAFYAAQKMKPLGAWDLHSLNRVRGPEALSGRDAMVAALHKLGFALK